jgi:hypothetical protein
MSLAPSWTGQIFRNQSGQTFRNHQHASKRAAAAKKSKAIPDDVA